MDVMVRFFYPVRTSLLIFLTLNASMSHVLPRAKGRVAVITAGRNTAIYFRQAGLDLHVSPRLHQFFDTELLHVWHQRVPICHAFCFRSLHQRVAAAAMIRFTSPLSVTRPDRATCMLHIRASPARSLGNPTLARPWRQIWHCRSSSVDAIPLFRLFFMQSTQR